MFEALVKSLKAFRREGGLNAAPASSDLFKNAKMPKGMSSDTVFGGLNDDAPKKPKKQESLFDDPMVLYGAIGAGALLLLSMLKKKK